MQPQFVDWANVVGKTIKAVFESPEAEDGVVILFEDNTYTQFEGVSCQGYGRLDNGPLSPDGAAEAFAAPP